MPVIRAGPPDLVQQSQLKGAGAVGIGQAHGAPACALRVQGVMSAREHDDGVGTDQHAPLPTDPDSSHLCAASMIIWLCSRDELVQVTGRSIPEHGVSAVTGAAVLRESPRRPQARRRWPPPAGAVCRGPLSSCLISRDYLRATVL